MPAEIDGGQPSQAQAGAASATFVLVALAFAGGYADAAAYLLLGTFTGHITGNTVLAAIALGAGKFSIFALRLTAVVAFLLATGAGILLSGLGLGAHRTLALALVMEAVLVGVAPLTHFAPGSHNDFAMLVCLCLALGLQNGVFSKDHGVSVHATYVTGDATSLVSSLLKKGSGQSSGKSPDRHTKNSVLGVIWPSFAVGALCAGLAVHWLGAHSLWLLEAPLLLATAAAWHRATGAAHAA